MREANVYSEIVPHTVTAAEIAAKRPSGIVLSGGPSSVYEEGAPQLDEAIFDLGVPVLGICYGFQVMATALGGEVANTGQREYGSTAVRIVDGTGGVLLDGQPDEQTAWMSHGDSVVAGARGLRGPRLHRIAPPSPRSRTTSAGSTACSGTPRSSTRRTARPCSRTSCTVPRASRPTGTAAT